MCHRLYQWDGKEVHLSAILSALQKESEGQCHAPVVREWVWVVGAYNQLWR
ncbi:MAG: hypothetical protein NZT92_09605 [Abditibacteriales bacterium]|nr:hypothetical protein [Abditibacteriales bacterium]